MNAEALAAWCRLLDLWTTADTVQWCDAGDGIVGRVRAAIDGVRARRATARRLDDVARVATGSGRDLRVLLVDRGDDPSAGWVADAVRALAPGGRLGVRLDAGVDASAVSAALHATGLVRPRVARDVAGDGRWFAWQRPAARPRIALLPDGPGACLQIRTLGPLEALEARGKVELTLLPSDADPSLLLDRDLLLLQRFGGPDALARLLDAREIGLPVAIEFDDDLFHVPWFNPGASLFARFDVRVLLAALVRGSNSVIASTPYLSRRLAELNPNVHAMHNLVDTDLFVRREFPADAADATVFGYIGTKTHREDLRPVVGPLRRMLLDGGGRVKAVFIGHVPEELARVPHVRYLGWFGTYHNAAAALARSGANVALAPLKDLEFNRSKSAMKYLEYGACGIPGIFSDVDAYRDFVRDGDNGWLVAGHDEASWEAALRRVVDDPAARARTADRAYADVVENHSIAARADDFLALYAPLIDTSETPPAPAAAPADPHPFEVVLVANGPVESALARWSGVRRVVPDGTRWTLVTAEPRLAETVRLAGPGAGAVVEEREGGVVEALRRSRAEWVLVVDESATLPRRTVERLLALRAEGVGAVGPRVARPGSPQSVDARIGRSVADANEIADALRAAPGDPVEPRESLDPLCVLLRRDALPELPADLLWGDAAARIWERLRHRGLTLVVANDCHVGHRHRAEAPPAPETRRRSRETLIGLGTRRDAPIDVWVVVGRDGDYLEPCLDALPTAIDVPARVHVAHAPDDATSARRARAAGFEAVARPERCEDPFALVASRSSAERVLVLHDGVRLVPGAAAEMLDVASRADAAVVVPFSNDGSPDQRLLVDPAGDDDFWENLRRTLDRRADAAHRVRGFTDACVLASRERLAGLDRGASATLAARAYAHLYDAPGPVGGVHGPWPGGPLDLDVPDLDALFAMTPGELADPRTYLARIRPLLEQARVHRTSARLHAAIGGVHRAHGDLVRAAESLRRARELDPFHPALRARERRLREEAVGATARV